MCFSQGLFQEKNKTKERNALFINHHIQRLGPKLSNPHLTPCTTLWFCYVAFKNNGFIIVSCV